MRRDREGIRRQGAGRKIQMMKFSQVGRAVRERTGAEKGAHRGGLDGVDDSRLKVEEHSAGHVLALAGLVVEDVDAVELSIVVAGVEAVAANAVLIAHDLWGVADEGEGENLDSNS